MKNILIMAVAGIGLFSATIVGVLAATGRLNHEGTQGIPVIAGFFHAPEEVSETEGTAADESETAHPQEPILGKEEPLAVNTDPLQEKPLSQAVGHAPEPEESMESVRQPQDDEMSQHPRDGETLEDTEHRHIMEELYGQRGNQGGRLFGFPPVESRVTADEINEAWRLAKLALADAKRRATVLDEMESLLAVREQDLHDREGALATKMKEIEGQQRMLDTRITQFHQDVNMIRDSELANLKSVGESLASLEPETAGLLIQDWWKTDDGQGRAVKVLAVMDKDAANAIIAALPIQQVKALLEQRLKLSREKPGGGP